MITVYHDITFSILDLNFVIEYQNLWEWVLLENNLSQLKVVKIVVTLTDSIGNSLWTFFSFTFCVLK